jgi:hypothetical protein
MKILIFTEGTVLMHKNAIGRSRTEIVKQVEGKEESINDYKSYIPIKNAVQKLTKWKEQGIEIVYLTSRTKAKEIDAIKKVLKKYDFPKGRLLFCKKGEEYKDIVEKVVPDILIEDDCESIRGENEMIITHVNSEIKKRIKSITVKEFGGIDNLPDSFK